MLHVFNASLSGRIDSIKNVGYLWKPKLNIYYVAAKETMKSGILPRILAYAGSVSIERTWRENGMDINRQVKMSDISNIGVALNDGWVITFPQGTTKPFKPVRKGTAHLIKHFKPKVIPIVIDGFRRSFDKKGLMIKKRGILQSMIIKNPLEIDYDNESLESIMEKIEYAIEQHPSFSRVIPNLSRIGLLTDNVRPKFEALGLLEYENAPDDFECDWAELRKPLEDLEKIPV